ncbi:MAG: hypothetical protein HYT76_07955 [Deltaproteobacteria bacterium]|nr:hypothetical protein [Deltaproteobacteria bacterium]
MKKILIAVTLAVVFAMSASVIAEEKAENPARKAAVEKCTKEGKTGKDLEACVDSELKVAEKKPTEQKAQ